jgi:hypothetical protein
MTQDLRVGRSAGGGSPTRARSKSVAPLSDEAHVPEMSGRMQAEVLLAEWQEMIAQEKESLAESIQSLSASVNKVRLHSPALCRRSQICRPVPDHQYVHHACTSLHVQLG